MQRGSLGQELQVGQAIATQARADEMVAGIAELMVFHPVVSVQSASAET